MIKSLKLTNFEGHADTKIEFSPNTTLIVGGNHKGKTSIFAAWEWLCTNRPAGRSFVREGETFCCVEADLGNCLIKRIVDTNLNRYVIKYKDNREETFNVVKDSVPSEVQSLLKHDSHNIQSQSESLALDTHRAQQP